MTDGLSINSRRFDHALARLAMTSKKSAVDVMRQQAGLVFANVAKYTPPASGGVTGKAAEKQGKAAVERDIRSLYGTPSDAFDDLGNDETASSFWYLYQHGDMEAAGHLVKASTGKSFAPFDGGALHSRTSGGRKRRSRGKREHVFYVSDPAELTQYIEAEQAHVWWLASGWREALTALGRPLPYGVGKQSAPGFLKVIINDQTITITMGNEVDYGKEVQGIERRILWAMNLQTKKLDKQWKYYQDRAAKAAGFKTS